MGQGLSLAYSGRLRKDQGSPGENPSVTAQPQRHLFRPASRVVRAAAEIESRKRSEEAE